MLVPGTYEEDDVFPYSAAPKMPAAQAQEDQFSQWVKKSNYNLNDDNLDYLYQQFFTEKNNETAWQRTMEADNTKYQRAVEDIKKAGLNPVQFLNAGVSSPGTASAGNISGGSIATKRSAEATQHNNTVNTAIQNATRVLTTMLIMIGMLL